ncbi:MAG: DUF5667 domain-containing protein [bacterium]|nr:DUF5667 domain-containing protein [bacterium]
MNKFFKHIEKETKHIRLSDAEKGVMRARLHEAMGVSVQPRATRSPYTHWFFMSRSFAFALVLAVLVGGGTTFAAEGSLPGDLLYPVKIHVSEQVETALALSPKAKVAVNTKLAQRRITEVEVLAVRGTLDANITAQAEEDFDYHTAQVMALTHQKNNKAHREDRATFSAKISASLDGDDDTGTSTLSVAAPAREEKEKPAKRSAKENSDNFKQHVRTRVQTILDLEEEDRTEAPSTDSEDRAPHEQDTSGRGEGQ